MRDPLESCSETEIVKKVFSLIEMGYLYVYLQIVLNLPGFFVNTSHERKFLAISLPFGGWGGGVGEGGGVVRM